MISNGNAIANSNGPSLLKKKSNSSTISTIIHGANKLNEYNIIQFGSNRIIMQHKKTKIKYIYKEIHALNDHQ